MDKLILWDIDGTLIHGGGVSGQALRLAMERVYGPLAATDWIAYAGKTDQQIIFETFTDRQQQDLLGALPHFTELYLAELEASRDEMRRRGRVLDGVVAALEHLAAREVVQTVLTGNFKPSASLKLEVFDLARYFDLEAGAYGSDHHLRDNLVPIAVARAEQRYGRRFAGHEVVVIGDTPRDIACGRAGGARTIAVASGSYGPDELRASGPDAVLTSLANTETLLAAIFDEHSDA